MFSDRRKRSDASAGKQRNCTRGVKNAVNLGVQCRVPFKFYFGAGISIHLVPMTKFSDRLTWSAIGGSNLIFQVKTKELHERC